MHKGISFLLNFSIPIIKNQFKLAFFEYIPLQPSQSFKTKGIAKIFKHNYLSLANISNSGGTSGVQKRQIFSQGFSDGI